MPWKNNNIERLLVESLKLIHSHFGIKISAEVYLCDEEEMRSAVNEELRQDKKSNIQIELFNKFYIPQVIAKFFKYRNKIYILHGKGKGETLSVLMHELLHSIQKCSIHREGIIDYIVYKIIKDPGIIPETKITEWEEIEKQHGFEMIKRRLVITGDCEDF